MGAKKEYLLVDGYNIIFAWDELKRIAQDSLEDARVKLLAFLCNYQGYTQAEVIVVFDAHKVKGGHLTVEDHYNIKVIYTKEAQTADSYIEWVVGFLSKRYRVRVATSDNLEQVIIMGKGAYRVSANELLHEIEKMNQKMREEYIEKRPIKNNMLLDNLDAKTAAILEKMRHARR